CSVTLTPNAAVNGNVKANFNALDNRWKNSVSGNFPLTVGLAPFSKLLILAPGETSAPGTATGKSGTPTAQIAGAPFNVTVRAVDAGWNFVASSDVVQLTSSDPNATLPANIAMTGGVRILSITLKTTASQTITATDV